MSGGTTAVVGDVRRVLVVGDSRPVDAAMAALSSHLESVSILRERTLERALERLTQLDVHCVVCPFGTVEASSLFESLHDRSDELPIVVVVDTADEASVEAALEAGATDVVDADDPRSLIAARVRNAANRYRLETADERSTPLLDRSEALVWVVDSEGVIESTSAAVEPRMGYTPNELERTPLVQFVHPDDRETVTETIESVSTSAFGATERETVRIGHADGSWHVYECSCTNRLGGRQVDGIVLTLETAPARDPDEAVRTAFDRIEEPVFSVGPQWELRYANEASEALFEPDTASPSGTVVWELLDDAVRGQFSERLREAATTGDVVEFGVSLPSIEGRLSVSVYPTEAGVTVYAREPERGSEGAAVDRDRFDLLESVVDGLEDGVVVLEGSTIRFANASLYELTDVDPIVGRELDALFDDDLAVAVRERSRSAVVRWMEPVTGTFTDDSDRDVDVFVTPLPDADRTLCVVRDRRRSSAGALSTVGQAVTAMRAADAQPDVRRAVVDGVLECTGADLAAWYLLEDDALRPTAVETTTASGPVELPSIDWATTDLLEALERDGGAGEDIGPVVFDRSELERFLSESGIRAERVVAVPAADYGVVLATSTEPMAFGERDRLPLETVVAAAESRLEALTRDSAVRECRTDLTRLESVVDRCHRLREVERTLLAGESRADIEQTLCDALVSLPFDETPGSIGLAWIGDVTSGSDRLTPDVWAGRDGDALESVSVPLDRDGAPTHPAARAMTSLEPALETNSAGGGTDDTGAWRRRGAERDYRSVLSVPLVVDEFCYGTLTVYADGRSTFDDAARDVCTHLAAVASHAIAGVERKRALLSEQVTELEIVLGGGDEPLASLARRLDRRLDIQTVVPRSSGGSTVFCTVSDVTDDALQAAIESSSAIESGRLLGDRPDASVLELVLSASTIATTLADHGGVLRSVTPAEDRTRLVVDLSSTVDVRSFVRLIERRQPGAKLVARRERDRSVQPARAFDAELRDQLSERQLRTLETAYYSGFFEWPRESTGEDVADSLGVSQPTFSRHLRLAQGKLFALLFDERDGVGER